MVVPIDLNIGHARSGRPWVYRTAGALEGIQKIITLCWACSISVPSAKKRADKIRLKIDLALDGVNKVNWILSEDD